MNLLANRSGASKGKIAHLREIVETQEPEVLAGLDVTPAMAERMLHWYDSLSPHLQELVAMEWNADFRSWVFRFAAFEALQVQGLLALVGR
jgi:hypothetical protein